MYFLINKRSALCDKNPSNKYHIVLLDFKVEFNAN